MTSTFAGPSYFNESNEIFKYRNQHMCSKWHKSDKDCGLFAIKSYQNEEGNIVLYGEVNKSILDYLKKYKVYLKYWAANSPTKTGSFSGSGLPYPTEEVAYENTKNQGNIEIYNLNFSLNFLKPNSYYTNQCKVLVRPHVNFMFITGENKPISGVYKIELDNFIPYRTLSMVRKNVMFYNNPNLPIRNQEQILQDSKYDGKLADNFWGLRPPN